LIRHSGGSVIPVKTGVHPHPLNLDAVFQRYDVTWMPAFAGMTKPLRLKASDFI
jgi:hypothetical protein